MSPLATVSESCNSQYRRNSDVFTRTAADVRGILPSVLTCQNKAHSHPIVAIDALNAVEIAIVTFIEIESFINFGLMLW